MSKIRVAISGATGRMGRSLIKTIQKSDDIELGAALVNKNSLFLGTDAGNLVGINKTGIIINNDILQVINSFDVLIDFTRPEGTLRYLNFCYQHKKSIVIGTTGFNDADKKVINNISKKIAIVFSANFSIGINLIFNLLQKTAKVLGNSTDIEIIEAHHRHKIDAPSGTALAMGKVITDTMKWNFRDHVVYAREGSNNIRKPNTIGFSSIRAGDIIGDHTVIFADIGERIEITHRASNRIIFANGAIKAAKWIYLQKPGLYNMSNVLNLT